eukprot:TRINITY_DN10258_c0_g1_i1.p4 TRINITY_DN10258_c0_g1~~TRINITY_DN10258_c0_g1_i1.p4  ORF type:complete len:189 (-),score=14.19 TRINITY_DN10258_c0_g1_i1:513-1079(-)
MSEAETGTVHMAMAVTKNTIIAYELRKQGYSEEPFLNFLINIAAKISELGVEYATKVVILMDGALFHTSARAKLLLSLLPFSVIIISPNLPELSAIETVFALLKQEIRRRASPNLQKKCDINQTREILVNDIHEVIEAMDREKLMKCYLHTIPYIEEGIRNIIASNEEIEENNSKVKVWPHKRKLESA